MTLSDKLRSAQVPVKPLVWIEGPTAAGEAFDATGIYVNRIVHQQDDWYLNATRKFSSMGSAIAAADEYQADVVRNHLAPDPIREAMIAALEEIAWANEHLTGIACHMSIGTSLGKLTAALEPK